MHRVPWNSCVPLAIPKISRVEEKKAVAAAATVVTKFYHMFIKRGCVCGRIISCEFRWNFVKPLESAAMPFEMSFFFVFGGKNVLVEAIVCKTMLAQWNSQLYIYFRFYHYSFEHLILFTTKMSNIMLNRRSELFNDVNTKFFNQIILPHAPIVNLINYLSA